VSAETSSTLEGHARALALESLTESAATNIPGVDFASITMYGEKDALGTVAATDPLAEKLDSVQYELAEGPCYAAVTKDRFVWINDVSTDDKYPRYSARAAELGVGAQAGLQLIDGKHRAGLNLYSRTPGAFDHSTVQLAELFATQAASVLGYAEQVEQLSEALHTRTDIGTAVGIVMERHHIDRNQAFAYLSRTSQNQNTKLRVLARHVINGTAELSLS
jgi:GAF domain-containing protein